MRRVVGIPSMDMAIIIMIGIMFSIADDET
jgi:hypothetical protein